MTLIDNRAPLVHHFCDIDLGQCFQWDYMIFIRVPRAVIMHDDYDEPFNAYAIAGTPMTNYTYNFEDDDIVDPVLATLTINYPSSAAGANDRGR